MWWIKDDGKEMEVSIPDMTPWQQAVLAQSAAPRTGRILSVASAINTVAFAICDLADALRSRNG